jgi:chemotaxis signal transduction protein
MTTVPAAVPRAPAQARACLIRLGSALYAAEVRYAREVVVFDEYTQVPLAPPYLIGVANLRGRIMPLVDLRPLLGLEPARATRAVKALVVERDQLTAAFLVDDVVGLEPLERLTAPEPDEGEFTAGRLEREGGAAVLLDVPRILTALGGASTAPASGS